MAVSNMEHLIFRGRLERWNDSKGFGFIKPDHGDQTIFIHISALKTMSRRPLPGDIISYQIHSDNTGKKRAVCASIAGVPPVQSKTPRRMQRNPEKNGGLLSKLLFVAIASLLAMIAFKQTDINSRVTATNPAAARIIRDIPRANYTCQGKVYCSQMTSCEEALFYQRHCPGTKMDGDGDGTPCESQWCGW